jgi:hypothetical protein
VPAPAQTLLTSASAARVRASPSTESAIVAQLPPGTELHQTGEAAGSAWIRVRLADGREGWGHGSLTRELPVGQRERIIEEVIRERLARERDPFDSYAELVDFIERTMPAAAACPLSPHVSRFTGCKRCSARSRRFRSAAATGRRRWRRGWKAGRRRSSTTSRAGCGCCSATSSSPI